MISSGLLLRLAIVGVLCLIVFFLGFALLNRLLISPPVNPEVPENLRRTASENIIQITVLNASGSRGAARTVTDYLRARGFDVVEIGNYDTILTRSVIIDRVGDSISTARVAYALGIADSMRQLDIDSTLYLRCVAVIGKDYPKLKPFR
ncbi:MAG: LytR C-terminal domain-containing protein [Bacteroidetes bacterium]|nr:LytR C-terminal domain-containing protein [Bacteroidota bacterium]MCZ2133339.1 LytR C-terminal domain-containing protein [Bacteroidota bacterium]